LKIYEKTLGVTHETTQHVLQNYLKLLSDTDQEKEIEKVLDEWSIKCEKNIIFERDTYPEVKLPTEEELQKLEESWKKLDIGDKDFDPDGFVFDEVNYKKELTQFFDSMKANGDLHLEAALQDVMMKELEDGSVLSKSQKRQFELAEGTEAKAKLIKEFLVAQEHITDEKYIENRTEEVLRDSNDVDGFDIGNVLRNEYDNSPEKEMFQKILKPN